MNELNVNLLGANNLFTEIHITFIWNMPSGRTGFERNVSAPGL